MIVFNEMSFDCMCVCCVCAYSIIVRGTNVKTEHTICGEFAHLERPDCATITFRLSLDFLSLEH